MLGKIMHHQQNDNRPIGVFDSGIGGLTVLRALVDALPHESFLYLGDTARLPYGSKSPQTIERYLKQNIAFLIRQNVKAIIVACNSVSTVLLGQNLNFSVPVYNVIGPGARTALSRSHTKKIGVLGTKATISARSYETSIQALDPTASIYSQACPLLVPLVEEGWEQDPVTRAIAARYLEPLLKKPNIDTLILGCTHYPALKKVIAEIAGPSVALVDSAEAILHDLQQDFARQQLHSSSKRDLPLSVMTTDVSPGFLEVARRLMSPHEIPELEGVDIG